MTLLASGDFFGEECMAGPSERRSTSATAISACKVLKIDRLELIRVLHEEHAFSDLSVQFIVVRGTRTQADLVDQLFNNSERRLARTLLLMANFGKASGPETLIAPITQETLSNMIGTTRSRVSFFMNRFRKLGYQLGRNPVSRTSVNSYAQHSLHSGHFVLIQDAGIASTGVGTPLLHPLHRMTTKWNRESGNSSIRTAKTMD